MMRKSYIYSILVLVLILSASACIEELEIEKAETSEGKGLLVVEASLTDKLMQQQVLLSRSDIRFDLETDTIYSEYYPLGIGNRDSVTVETNATVNVRQGNGTIYNFFEAEPGVYLSSQPFALSLNTAYILEISTTDGVDYVSDELLIESQAELLDVNVERTFNDQDVEGLEISVNSRAINGAPSRFRYAYEETFKIIAPSWKPKDFRLTNYDPCALPVPTYDLDIIERDEQNRVCYNTIPSNSVIQTKIVDDASGVNDFPVRFINRNNFIISHRYSILIKQYVQSAEAFSFYETIKNFSNSDNVFSQIQPGALTANIKRRDGASTTVLGYAEAVSISEKRIFFDYEDFFSGEALPDYPNSCIERSSPESHRSYCSTAPPGANACPLSTIESINLGLISYIGNNDAGIGSCPGPYIFVPQICGDCTVLGDNTVPEFWVED